MGMVKVVFACAVQLLIIRTGESYTLLTGYPTKTEYLPGESVSFHCSGSTTGDEENVMVQLPKLGYYLPRYRGATWSSQKGYPVVLATNDEIDSHVQQKAPGRYTATGSSNNFEFDYTYTITDLKLEDYGNFSCSVKVGENGKITPSSGYAQVRVLGPVLNMAIMYSQRRADWEDIVERTNPDNKITWVERDSDGYLTCMVQYTTSPLTEWSVTLYDPSTKTHTDVKYVFWDSFVWHKVLPTVAAGDEAFHSLVSDHHFIARVPRYYKDSGEVFGYEDSGKTLTCTCKVRGYDEVYKATTVLDIQFPPKETSCSPESPKASVGTKNFKLLCYTRSKPTATVIWKANNEAPRQGVTVENRNKGPYQVSVLTIDEVQESDFTSYSFEATNKHGTVTFPESGQTAWEIKKGSAVNQASDVESGSYPWNTSGASMMSTAGALLVLLVLSSVLYWTTEH